MSAHALFHRIAASCAILLLNLPISNAQDTLRVQTLTFDSITTRRGWWVFPDEGQTYRKVLMHHTLKCSPLTTQDQYACGEWDYLTYSFVHDHTGVLDSTAMTHPWFLVGTLAPDSLELHPDPVFDVYHTNLTNLLLQGTSDEQVFSLGTGGAVEDNLLQSADGVSRSQFLLTADELLAAGLDAGPIQQLRFTTTGTGPAVERLTMRLRNFTGSLNGTVNDGLVLVYDGIPEGLADQPGEQVLMLATPFDWDGTSNLLIDLAAETAGGPGALGVVASPVAAGMALQDTGYDGYLALMNDHIAVEPDPLATLGDQVTITFRTRGDASLPLNTTLLEAVNAQNQRVLNIHLPWSNGRVYWDAGNAGSAYDRIDKAATPAEYQGQWNHWAFVKNTATGSMKIYLNGSLWHSGTGLTRPMAGITKFRIGSGHNGSNPYTGHLDELAIFSTELDAATIAAWKDRKVDGTHPQAADLLYSFHFDEDVDDFTVLNAADPSQGGVLMGTVQRLRHPAMALGASAIASAVRPDVVLGRGTYVTDTIEQPYTTAVPQPGITQQFFAVEDHAAVPTGLVHGWMAGWSYTFAPDGTPIDSAEVTGTTTINDTLEYFGVPFEVVDNYEIGRFITPYGIGLSLGPNGFRWTYDVTDYQWLLHDSVEFSAGNQQELIDVQFEMITGTPPRPLVNMQRPWGAQRSMSYAALSNDTQLPPVEVTFHPAATQWTLRTRLTGHGHASNTGNYPHCCEWKDNTHYLHVDGTPADEWHIWQTNDCALNPVYPQGGTWLNAREGWCPGDLVKDHDVELTPHVNGPTATLDYSITPVPANNLGMGAGNYVVNMDLMEYGAAAFPVDAEIYEVKRPSTADYFRRENPICYDPVVVLRNAGAQELNSVTFTYGVSGGSSLTHTWTGSLGHMERADVVLPVPDGSFWYGDDEHRFTVTAGAPNGAGDPHPDNDSYTTPFELPVVYTDNFIIDYRTNNRPQQNTVTIRDVHGNIKFQRSVHTANTVYRDTLQLDHGCYTLEVLDTGNDGLSYWADSQQGSGYFRFRRMTNTILKTFEPEFGRSIHWAFVIGDFVGMEGTTVTTRATVFPNPGEGLFTAQVDGLTGPALLEVTDLSGRPVLQQKAVLIGNDQLHVDLTGYANGPYLLRIRTDDGNAVVRLVKQ